MPTWKFNQEKEKELFNLLSLLAPSSFEVDVAQYVRNRMSAFCDTITTDSLGNVLGIMNSKVDNKIALVAHMDEVAIQVVSITSQGLLKFRRIGGIKPISLIGQRVSILTKNGMVDGVIGFDILNNNETTDGFLVRSSHLWIDICAETAEAAKKTVSVGDFAVFKDNACNIAGTKIMSKGLDNKVGIFVMLEVMHTLKKKGCNMGICGIGTVQEEIGVRGVASIAQQILPMAAFVVDVDYATDIPNSDADILGSLELGKGVGLTNNADNNIVLKQIVRDVAQSQNILTQETLGRSFSGGTDAKKLQTISPSVACVNINIPNRYMHTAIEICDMRDIESAINLLLKTIIKIEEDNRISFIPGIN